MTVTQQILLAALSASLFERRLPELQGVKWSDVFNEAKKQCVTCLVYDGLKGHLPANISDTWQGYNLQVISHNARLLYEERKLVALLEGAGVPFCILKGTAAAIYYPKPMLRAMGDIDFIVPQHCFDEAWALLEAAGYTLNTSGLDEPRHLTFHKDGVLFEMHHFFDDQIPEVDACIERCMGILSVGTVNGTVFPMLPKLENGITLLDHVRHHLYEGIGLRQILDWMLYINTVGDDSYWKNTLEPELSRLGLKQMAMVMTRMCQIYLGLREDIDWCAGVNEEVCEQLMGSILRSGNFGHSDRDGKFVENAVVRMREQGAFRYLQQHGEETWEAYHRHPWLKPFAWAYQIIRFILNVLHLHRSGAQLKDDLKHGADRSDLLQKLGLM